MKLGRGLVFLRWLSVPLRALALAFFVYSALWAVMLFSLESPAREAAAVNGRVEMGAGQDSKLVNKEVENLAQRLDLHGGAAKLWIDRSLGWPKGDWGRAWRSENNSLLLFSGGKGRRSLAIALLALLSAILIAIPGAMYSAQRAVAKDKKAMSLTCIELGATILIVLPLPWLALFLLRFLAYGQPFSWAQDSHALAIVAASLSLALPTAAVLWSYSHQEFVSIWRAAWVEASLAKGVCPARLWRVHISRAAAPTLIALLPRLGAFCLAGTMVVEGIFGVQALGDVLVHSAQIRDLPVLIAIASVLAFALSLLSSLSEFLRGKLLVGKEGR